MAEYKVQITITGQTGAGTDYQVPIYVGESSGSSGDNFDLDALSTDFPAAKDDGGDFRFYAADETTPLDFWVESVSGSGPNRTALIWVKVTADLGSNQNIWLYFNGGGANESDGEATFISFDDFPGSSIDSAKWDTKGSGGAVSVASDEVKISVTSNSSTLGIQGKTDFSVGKSMRMRIRRTNSSAGNNSAGLMGSKATLGSFQTPSAQFNRDSFTGGTTNRIRWGQSGDPTTETQANHGLDTTLSVFEVKWASGDLKFHKEGQTDVTKTASVPSSDMRPFLSAERNTALTETWADWIALRKYQVTEPVFNSAGAITPIATFTPSPMMHMMGISGGLM